MKTYIADTNIFLRFFLKDNIAQAEKSKRYIAQAQSGKIKIIILPEVLFEIEYVLRKVYGLDRSAIVYYMYHIAGNDVYEVHEQKLWITALSLYKKRSVDLNDIGILRN